MHEVQPFCVIPFTTGSPGQVGHRHAAQPSETPRRWKSQSVFRQGHKEDIQGSIQVVLWNQLSSV